MCFWKHTELVRAENKRRTHLIRILFVKDCIRGWRVSSEFTAWRFFQTKSVMALNGQLQESLDFIDLDRDVA